MQIEMLINCNFVNPNFHQSSQYPIIDKLSIYSFKFKFKDLFESLVGS